MRRLVFVILSGLLALLLFVALGQDMNRDWTRYQRRFLKTLANNERQGVTGGIQQIIVSDLKRVDRCTTCHLAIEKPQLALAEEPFKAHPGRYLAWHPVEKFGCTVCHGGQGLATETAAAHGDVPHWEEPLLRGPLVQASCAQCHGNLQPIADYAPVLLKGRALFKAKGCYGCHAVKEFGQAVSQDLTEVGSKSYQLIEADFEMMDPPHDRIRWFMRKLSNPRALNPGVRPEHLPPDEEEVFPSAMPNFGLKDDEVLALAVYLLSLTESDPPASYVRPARPEPDRIYASAIERGQAVFEQYGCAACHGIGGVGGRRNWNAGLGEEVPPLVYVKAYYGNEEQSLKELIRNGRQPVPRADAHRPNPSLYMPAWKDRISEEDLDALVAYLFSLADRLPQPNPQASSPRQPGGSASAKAIHPE
ncbi:MAG: c-type cytochrome [Candidatus Omnitrophica bacterium]|nr:c-type cytochrome [Candidatus Omnitrophota bacterium]